MEFLRDFGGVLEISSLSMSVLLSLLLLELRESLLFYLSLSGRYYFNELAFDFAYYSLDEDPLEFLLASSILSFFLFGLSILILD